MGLNDYPLSVLAVALGTILIGCGGGDEGSRKSTSNQSGEAASKIEACVTDWNSSDGEEVRADLNGIAVGLGFDRVIVRTSDAFACEVIPPMTREGSGTAYRLDSLEASGRWTSKIVLPGDPSHARTQTVGPNATVNVVQSDSLEVADERGLLTLDP